MEDPEFDVPDEATVSVDYWGGGRSEDYILPDGRQWVTIKVMTEGDRRKYLNAVNRGVKINKGTGDTELDLRPGDDRFNLLKTAISNWYLERNGLPVPFSPPNLIDFLDAVSPKIADLIEKKVREVNPWLRADMTVEDVDKEIENLLELRAELVAELEGKGSSD